MELETTIGLKIYITPEGVKAIYEDAGLSGCVIVLKDGSKHYVWNKYEEVKKFIRVKNS